MDLYQRLAYKNLGFVAHVVFVATTRLCHCRGKATVGNMETNGFGCVPIQMYLQESVIQSEVSQKEKNKYRMLTHIYGI